MHAEQKNSTHDSLCEPEQYCTQLCTGIKISTHDSASESKLVHMTQHVSQKYTINSTYDFAYEPNK